MFSLHIKKTWNHKMRIALFFGFFSISKAGLIRPVLKPLFFTDGLLEKSHF